MSYHAHDLHPLYTNQKSFYGKATVTVMDDGGDVYMILRSYDTQVVSVYVAPDGAPFVKKLWKGYSVTTLRHMNELLMEQGFPKLSARAWRAMEIGKFYSSGDVPALEKSLK